MAVPENVFVLSDCRKRPLQRALVCGFHLRQDFNVAKWCASGKQFVLYFVLSCLRADLYSFVSLVLDRMNFVHNTH